MKLNLTPAQKRVIGMLCEGHTMEQIATAFGLSPAAISMRVTHAREVNEIKTTAQLCAVWAREGTI